MTVLDSIPYASKFYGALQFIENHDTSIPIAVQTLDKTILVGFVHSLAGGNLYLSTSQGTKAIRYDKIYNVYSG